METPRVKRRKLNSFSSEPSQVSSPIVLSRSVSPDALKQGGGLSSSSDGLASSASPCPELSSQSSASGSEDNNITVRSPGQFRLRDLAMKIRHIIYSHVWPCDNNSGALLIALSHDSKLRHDLEEAIACRERHQAYKVTIDNFEAFKAMRRRMEDIKNITVWRDYTAVEATEPPIRGWSTLSGCHCTMRNFFKVMKIHAIVDPRQGKFDWPDGVIVAKTLIRASLLENGDPTTMIMTVEAREPFTYRFKEKLQKQLAVIDRGVGFSGFHEELRGGKVLQTTWNNGARLTWS